MEAKYCASVVKLFNDNGKPAERQGRKTKGPGSGSSTNPPNGSQFPKGEFFVC